MLEPSTWIDVVAEKVVRRGDDVCFTFLAHDESEAARLTYSALHAQAQSIAASLQQRTRPGDRVVLLFPPGLDFVSTFFGCIYAGVIAVPSPLRARRTKRIDVIISNVDPTVIITPSTVRDRRDAIASLTSTRHSWLTFEELVATDPAYWRRPQVDPATPVLIQYTSGSTCHPKGAIISHRNLLHNSKTIKTSFGLSTDSVSVSWLPVYHDMGLIDGILQPLYTGYPAYLMAPSAFLQRPVRWLRTISRVRATHSGGPDFGYALCVRKISNEERLDLDLRCWTSAYNGSEPVRSATLKSFASAFHKNGFEPRFFYPCYGLAEATLMVTGGALHRTPPEYSPASINGKDGDSNPAPLKERAGPLIGCGWPWLGTEVVIVDPGTLRECGSDTVGEIWIRGDSVAQGYWRKPDETAAVFGAHVANTNEGPFLRTGDLGLTHNGELYIIGRLKDLLNIRGAKYPPEQIELTVEESHPLIHAGSTATFTVEINGMNELVIVHEFERRSCPPDRLQEIVSAIRSGVAKNHDLSVHTVIVVRAGGLSRTSSGKVQRYACRDDFIEGTLPELTRSQLSAGGVEGDTLTSLSRWELIEMSSEDQVAILSEYVRTNLSRLLDLPRDSVDMRQPLVGLGLDSLHATEFIHGVASVFDVVLDVAALLGDMTPDDVVRHAVTRIQAYAEESRHPSESTAEFLLSDGQRALWFLHQLAPTGSAYNVAFAARLTGVIDVKALRRSFRYLCERHASLRSTIGECESEFRQRVAPVPVAEVEEIFADHRSESELKADLTSASREPFDLEHGPLIRARLYHNVGGAFLLLVAHHIVVDGWSLSVLLHEWEEAYLAARAGDSHPQLPPAPQPNDFVRWQRDFVAGPEGARQRHYWSRQLQGSDLSLDLSLALSSKPRPKLENEVVSHDLDHELVHDLRGLARNQNVTFYTLLLASVQLLLHRYTGHDDIVVRSTVDGRRRPEFAGVVGYLANQLLMRTSFVGNPLFKELLHQVRTTVLGALAHQDYPFPRLVQELNPQRDRTGHTLARLVFVLQRLHGKKALTPLVFGREGSRVTWKDGLNLEAFPIDTPGVPLDLILTVIDQGNDCTVRWDFDCNRFDPADIVRLSDHWRTLLTAIVDEPNRRIGDMSLLSDGEWRTQALDWNQTKAVYPRQQCIHELFEAQARATPDNIAVECSGQTLTYRELNQRANELALNLLKHGAGPEKLIACCLPQSLDLLPALLSVLKVGAAYIPLDPSLPPGRIARLINDADVLLVVTHTDLERTLSGTRPVLVVDRDRGGRDRTQLGEEFPFPRAEAGSESLAYVIYTSGSTGEPKGVMVPHRAMVNYLTWCNRFYEMTAGDGAPLTLSIGFDASITSLFAPLLAGRTVTLMAEGIDIAAIADTLRRPGYFSLVKLTPAHLQVLHRFLAEDNRIATRLVVVGGESLTPTVVSPWLKLDPCPRMVNEYGPTEATVGCCVHEVGNEDLERGFIPIGRPIANTQLYVLDRYQQLVPVGVTGELYIAGDGLAYGYLNRPDLTAERFLQNPFVPEPGGHVFRTGDLARYHASGTIEYLGRIDDQIKLHSFRIEPAEIEAALSRCPQVESAVVALKQVNGDRQLVAYLRCRTGEALDTRNLRQQLATDLPEQMVPASFVVLDEFPLTSHGKIDRNRLPPPTSVKRSGLHPVTGLQRLIADVWRRVLRLDHIDLDDNFFDLGGSSLRASEVQYGLQMQLGRGVPLRSILEFATVRSLAQHLAGDSGEPEPDEVEMTRARAHRQLEVRRRLAVRAQQGIGPSADSEIS